MKVYYHHHPASGSQTEGVLIFETLEAGRLWIVYVCYLDNYCLGKVLFDKKLSDHYPQESKRTSSKQFISIKIKGIELF